ncbi:MAG: hypothetical protein HY898_17225 [Deltaproteobacteria bacterium]|nr:hypothetical protein [Deltaproteobacteria bacterium]
MLQGSRAWAPLGRAVGWILLASAALVRPAMAQDSSRAEALFNEGLKNMQAARYDQACPALAESYKLDPLPGVLFTVAECEAAWGRIATALGHYDEFLRVLTTLAPAQQKKHQERRQIALEKVAALARLAPQLTIVVPAGAPAGLAVKRNGTPIDTLSYGVATPVDPGTYVVTFEVPGQPAIERRVLLSKGQTVTVGGDVKWAGKDTPATVGSAALPDKADGGASTAAPDRTLAWVVGGIGVAGLAVGAVTGILTMSKKSTIDSECPDRQCTPDGRSAVDSAQTTGLISTIGFGVGIVGLAGGAILYLTAKPPAQSTPAKGASWTPVITGGNHGGMAGLQGTF